jgi:mannose-6-phosphate isomerase class I
MTSSNYDKYPYLEIESKNQPVITGWKEIIRTIKCRAEQTEGENKVIVFETYPGADDAIAASELLKYFSPALFIRMDDLYYDEDEINRICYPDVTDDRTFGFMTRLTINDFIDEEKLRNARQTINSAKQGLILLFGCGASEITESYDLLIYSDLTRYEIQQRMRSNRMANLGTADYNLEFERKYKRAFFVDWRVADRVKRKCFGNCNYVIDANITDSPVMIPAELFNTSLKAAVNRPFRLVPFFDPGPWGGQWMKKVIAPDKEEDNFAWCFDCVPEENSIRFKFNEIIFETPAINLVFFQPQALLGERVYARFGAEFPIRFDFLDTMEGGNLSLQVHPTTEYIREKFGMFYTQDESYYLLDAGDDARVYLGLKDGVDKEAMLNELKSAQEGGQSFSADKYTASWPAKKHDHFLIPAGTVHCSAVNCMVLEISATPYIFTFKLWDWGRMGLDGQPRAINIEHGEKVINWNRTESWVRDELINRVTMVSDKDGVREERTGMHEYEFIETIRHWFTGKVSHISQGSVNVLNLVEGREAIIESPSSAFEPFVVHYAETFIIPANIGEYTIRPFGESEGKRCATIKAFIRQ